MVGLTKKKIKSAIGGSGGIIQVVAKKCGVSRTWMSITLHKPQNANLLELIQEEREKLLDMTESKLISEIKEGYFPAIKWYLTTQGKDRGYGDKQEVEHVGVQEVKVIFQESSNEKHDE